MTLNIEQIYYLVRGLDSDMPVFIHDEKGNYYTVKDVQLTELWEDSEEKFPALVITFSDNAHFLLSLTTEEMANVVGVIKQELKTVTNTFHSLPPTETSDIEFYAKQIIRLKNILARLEK